MGWERRFERVRTSIVALQQELERRVSLYSIFR